MYIRKESEPRFVILQCLKNDNIVIEGNGDTEGEGFHNSEGRQVKEIPGMTMTLPIENPKINESAE